ncbi:hypothetical protein SprV_0100009200 [Sparganum proliferum]
MVAKACSSSQSRVCTPSGLEVLEWDEDYCLIQFSIAILPSTIHSQAPSDGMNGALLNVAVKSPMVVKDMTQAALGAGGFRLSRKVWSSSTSWRNIAPSNQSRLWSWCPCSSSPPPSPRPLLFPLLPLLLILLPSSSSFPSFSSSSATPLLLQVWNGTKITA